MTPEDKVEQIEASLHPGPAMLQRAWIIRGRRILRIVTSFVIGQGMAQGLTVLASLFLVHRLTLQAYAQFSLAIGFQTMFSTLMDFGFAGTIVPMVGANKDDRALVGRYVRSAKHLRDLAFYILGPIAVIAFYAIVYKQHWPWHIQTALLASILVALYAGGKSSYFSAALILHGRLRSYYVFQVIAGLFKVCSYVVLAYTGVLNAWIAAGIGALAIFFTAECYAREAKPLMDWPAHDDPATDKSIFQYILPAAPAIIFTAFQAQLTLFLISIFGGQTVYIAQVAALGRIGQLFTVLTTFNLLVVEPFVARVNHRRLFPTFVTLTCLACVGLAPIVYAAYTWPQAFLYLIGPKYNTLQALTGWVILAATINYIAGLIWMMNRSRKWIFWSGSLLEIGLLCIVQIVFVVMVGVRNTRDAVFLTVLASICVLLSHTYVAVLGFWQDHRARLSDSRPLPASS